LSEPANDLEALRRAFAAVPAVAPAPESCPPAERFLAAVHGELPPAELRELVEHVAGCPACAEDWRLAVALEKSPGEVPETVHDAPWPRSARHRVRRVAAWWASAAAAAPLAVATFLARAPVPALRGEKPPELLTAADVLPRDACLLRWSGPAGAVYDLDVHTQIGMSVFKVRELRGTSYYVPASALAALPPGTPLDWQVAATLPGGHRLTSRIGKFILH